MIADNEQGGGDALYYRPSAGDLRYRNATVNGAGPNPFDEAILLRGISDAYLSVLIHDNSGDRSIAFRAMLDAENARRAQVAAARANMIAGASLAVALLSLAVAVAAAAVGH